jgi:hypothetical protein
VTSSSSSSTRQIFSRSRGQFSAHSRPHQSLGDLALAEQRYQDRHEGLQVAPALPGPEGDGRLAPAGERGEQRRHLEQGGGDQHQQHGPGGEGEHRHRRQHPERREHSDQSQPESPELRLVPAAAAFRGGHRRLGAVGQRHAAQVQNRRLDRFSRRQHEVHRLSERAGKAPGHGCRFHRPRRGQHHRGPGTRQRHNVVAQAERGAEDVDQPGIGGQRSDAASPAQRLRGDVEPRLLFDTGGKHGVLQRHAAQQPPGPRAGHHGGGHGAGASHHVDQGDVERTQCRQPQRDRRRRGGDTGGRQASREQPQDSAGHAYPPLSEPEFAGSG